MLATRTLCVLLGLSLFCTVLLGESLEGVIRGQVLDDREQPIGEAEVIILKAGQELVRMNTDPAGHFVFLGPFSLPSSYRLRISKNGYTSKELQISTGMSTVVKLFRQPAEFFDIFPRVQTLQKIMATETATLDIHFDVKIDARWNRWIEDAEAKIVQQPLTVGQDYAIHFDLAGLNYQDLGLPSITVTANPTLSEELSASKAARYRILVKPFLENDVGRFVFDEGRARLYEISLDKLRRSQEIADSLKGTTDPSKYSEALAAVSIPITIHADRAGCAQLGFVLWDADLNHPLDVVRTTLNVAATGASVSSPCGGNDSVRALSAGVAETLLSSQATPKAAAGLFLFEFSGEAQDEIKNTALFIGSDSTIFTWSPPRKLVNYVFGEGTDSIANQLRKVHCKIAGCHEDIGPVARALTKLLFDDATERGRAQARDALKSLSGVAADHVIAFRFTDQRGNTKPFPFGLIEIESGARIGDLSTIIEPLPSARFTSEKDCFSAWTDVIPAWFGEDLDLTYLQAVEYPPASLVRDWPGLLKYFNGTNSDTQGEGLVLLVHHVDGVLFFDPKDRENPNQSIQTFMIKRRYHRGSVAVLSSCATSSLSSSNENLPLITQLAENGVNAMVSAPFEIDSALAAQFAINFSYQVSLAQIDPREWTFRELFKEARKLTENVEAVSSWTGELAELILLGNADLRMCKGGGKGKR